MKVETVTYVVRGCKLTYERQTFTSVADASAHLTEAELLKRINYAHDLIRRHDARAPARAPKVK